MVFDFNEVTQRTNQFENFCTRTGWHPFEYYFVQIQLQNIAGGIPKDPEIYKKFVEAKCKEKTEADRTRLKEAHLEQLPEIVNEEAQAGWTGFLSDERGLYIEGRQVKAMFKEAANIIKDIAPGRAYRKKNQPKVDKDSRKKGHLPPSIDPEEDEVAAEPTEKVVGISALKSKVADQLFILNDKELVDPKDPTKVIKTMVHLGKTDKDIVVSERPIHAMTPKGEISAIKITDTLKDVTISWIIQLRKKSEVSLDTVMAILNYCQTLGLGADRSQGMGMFNVKTVTSVTRAEAYELLLQQ
jgi:hypothetical protein